MLPESSRWILLVLCFVNRFAENTGKLQVHNIQVPNPFILGSSSDLFCNYTWTHPETESRPIYSIKWYKENAEFFRFVPSEEPAMVSFDKDGIFVDITRSTPQVVHLRTTQWTTAGNYRCEVTAEDFETASKSVKAIVVAVPSKDPYIEGNKLKYSLGEVVELNCTSNASDPMADLFWYINGLPAGEEMLFRYPRIREPTNLLTAVLGLRFHVASQHLRANFVRVKCTAMLLTVYLKSNEITFEVKRPQKLPALESREKNSSKNSIGGNQLKEPPIKTNEPGPYFGFGVNQSSQPMVSAQYTACQFILILVLHLWQAIWH